MNPRLALGTLCLLGGLWVLGSQRLTVWLRGAELGVPSHFLLLGVLGVVLGAGMVVPGRRAGKRVPTWLLLVAAGASLVAVVMARRALPLRVGTYVTGDAIEGCRTVEVVPGARGALGFRCTSGDPADARLGMVWDGSRVVTRAGFAGTAGQLYRSLWPDGVEYAVGAWSSAHYSPVKASEANGVVLRALDADWRRLRWRCEVSRDETLMVDVAAATCAVTRFSMVRYGEAEYRVPLWTMTGVVSELVTASREEPDLLRASATFVCRYPEEKARVSVTLFRERPRAAALASWDEVRGALVDGAPEHVLSSRQAQCEIAR